jgi:putative membrane protein
MQQTRTFSDKVFLVLKGLAMGAANKVPGVSGGVVAFVAGFYEEFIYSLQKINFKAFKLLLNGRFKSLYRYVNGRFLGLLVIGMVISYFSISQLLDYLIDHYELYVWASFFGMIIGSIYYISKDFKNWSRRSITFMLLGAIVGIAISFLEPARENDNLWFVFICGIIGVSGMTLPGLSGSFILILLGNYVLLLVESVNALFNTIKDVFMMDFSFIDNSQRVRLLQVLVVFSLGSLAGLVSLSHLLGFVLKRYKNETYSVIIGFIAGSLGVVWPWKERIYKLNANGDFRIDIHGNRVLDNYDRYFPTFASLETWLAIFFIVIGVFIVLGLGWYENRNKAI